MPHQSKSNGFMAELDRWVEQNVIDPLGRALAEEESAEELGQSVSRIKREIRERVLDSYRNGQQAPAAAPRQEFKRREYQKQK